MGYVRVPVWVLFRNYLKISIGCGMCGFFLGYIIYREAMVELFAANGWNVAATVWNREQHKGLFEKLPTVRLYELEVTDYA